LRGRTKPLSCAIVPVGVITNLSIWFAVHVVFTRVACRDVGPLRLIVPD
jgi:chromate transporter